ncbi:hypothetical protein ACTOB_000263 [Actinoplanes oblitus]|uniref:Uncharacterized protein n=1 Tax=Actinoplanes oblitus TaxID=3040509 RepID=A0ABY8WIB0_9ACTN|nr:hypothetical protein [Actinoplanes oblitus]WIM96796.1 hypothetical protein ACTOB_000263 [Actinoplanes oblitus]
MRSHHTIRIGIAVATGALAAGCGASSSAGPAASAAPSQAASAASTAPSSPESGPATSGASARPSSPSAGTSGPAALPTLTRPVKPPKNPTDTVPNTGWVLGVVTRGGSGPCYGFTADNGTQFALHSTDGITLTTGGRVKVKLTTTMLKIYCGPGQLMAMTAAEPIG